MNKFYGGGTARGFEAAGHTAETRGITTSGGQLSMAQAGRLPGSHGAERSASAARRSSALPASTYQGPSREGISGERAAPDSGTAQEHAPDWRYFRSHTYEELSRGF